MRTYRTLVAARLIVNLRSGTAIEGYLVRERGGLLFLRQAVVHEPGAQPAPADGEVIVERRVVDFIQRPDLEVSS